MTRQRISSIILSTVIFATQSHEGSHLKSLFPSLAHPLILLSVLLVFLVSWFCYLGVHCEYTDYQQHTQLCCTLKSTLTPSPTCRSDLLLATARCSHRDFPSPDVTPYDDREANIIGDFGRRIYIYIHHEQTDKRD